ncbi:MAG: hypothetical protein IJU59_06935 [Firmicutes bacterium]|nr:hypothetical protein [Bacillota bacterium]
MDTVLTFKDLLILGVGISAIVLLIYLIRLTATLIKTLKKTNAVLDDTQVITSIAAERTKEVDAAVGDAIGVVASVAGSIKGRQGVVGSVTTLAAAVGALRELLVDLGILHPKAAPEAPEAAGNDTEAEKFEDEYTGE